MILTHGSNSISRGRDSPFLFLTYFNNFDSVTGIDTPIIGEPYTLNINSQELTNSTLSLFNMQCPAIKDEYKADALVSNVIQIPSDYSFLSSEAFILCEGTRSDYNMEFYIADIGCTFDPVYSNTEFQVSGPSIGGYSSNDYTLYNGTIPYSSGGYLFTKFGKNIRYKLSHLAFVFDKVNMTKRLYVDGEIMLEIRNSGLGQVKFGMRQRNTGKSMTVTGVAFITKDMSINDGMNYPVPTSPYYPIT